MRCLHLHKRSDEREHKMIDSILNAVLGLAIGVVIGIVITFLLLVIVNWLIKNLPG